MLIVDPFVCCVCRYFVCILRNTMPQKVLTALNGINTLLLTPAPLTTGCALLQGHPILQQAAHHNQLRPPLCPPHGLVSMKLNLPLPSSCAWLMAPEWWPDSTLHTQSHTSGSSSKQQGLTWRKAMRCRWLAFHQSN